MKNSIYATLYFFYNIYLKIKKKIKKDKGGLTY
jgi:hypothetical protein